MQTGFPSLKILAKRCYVAVGNILVSSFHAKKTPLKYIFYTSDSVITQKCYNIKRFKWINPLYISSEILKNIDFLMI